mmetsp:Transcript_21036/g.67786  ORF Transcript_21036/g.67786 Transcript_21036/m.67786 type:complete len:241 (+) Transcript_21036:2862-3584(+)
MPAFRRSTVASSFSTSTSSSWRSARASPPKAFSVSFNNPTSSNAENSPTFSCGRNVHRLAIWMLKSSLTTALTAASFATRPSRNHLFCCLDFLKISRRTVRVFPFLASCSSTSTKPSSFPVRTNSKILSARPRIRGDAPSARAIAHTILDLPVPFGPMITFSRGPGENSTSSYVKKLCITTLRIIPVLYGRRWAIGLPSFLRGLGDDEADEAAPSKEPLCSSNHARSESHSRRRETSSCV